MAAPTASNPGSNVNNLGAAAAALPAAAPAVGNLAVLVCAHRDTAVGTPTPSDTAGFGPWSQIGSTVVQGAAQLTVWTAVVESTTPTAPTVSDSGDHTQTRLFYLSHASGTPEVHATATSTDPTSDTSGNATSPTTTVADCLVMLFGAGDTPDSIGTAEYTTPANTSLTSIIEVADNSVSTGGGGSKIIAKGIKAAAGAVADWTYTKTTAGVKAHRVVAFSPPQPPAKSGSSSVRGGGRVTSVGEGPPVAEPTFDATLGTVTNAASLVTSVAAAAGSRIFLFVWHYDAQANECTGASDNGAGGSLTWVKDHGTTILSDGGSRLTILSADAPAGLASGTTITPTFSLGAVDFGPGMAAHSWVGVKDGASGYLDATSTTKQDFAEAWTTNNLVTSDAKSLLFGFSLGGASGQSHSPATNYDERHDWTAEGANRCAVVSRVADAGTYTPGGTWAVSVDQQANIGVAYQAAPADTGATGASSVRGGGAAASSGAKAASGSSSVRGGGAAASVGRKATQATSTVRGGGSVVTVGARGVETHSGTSSVRGGGAVASTVRKGAVGVSTARGGGSAASAGLKIAAAASSVRGGGAVITATSAGASSASSVRGGGLVASSTRKGAQATSTVRGGGAVASSGTQLQARSGSSSVRGGGSASSSVRKTGTAVSTVRGGGLVAGAGRKATSSTSTVRGGGLVASTGTQQIAKTGTSSVRGGGLVAGVGRKATSSTSTARGGGFVTSSTRKSSTSTSSVRGGGFVTSTGSQQIAKTGVSSVRGGGRPTSSGLKAASSISSSRGGGFVRSTVRKSASSTSSARGGGFVSSTARKTSSASSTVTGGGFVTSTTVSGQAAQAPVTWRTGTGPGTNGRTSSGNGTGRTLAGSLSNGRTRSGADAGLTIAGSMTSGETSSDLTEGGD